MVSRARGVAAAPASEGRPEWIQSRRHRKAVGIERVPHQRGMLIVGEVKIRHSGDMGSRSRRAALYHGFLEQTVARVTVTTLLQRGYNGQRMSASAPERPDELYKKEHTSAAPS